MPSAASGVVVCQYLLHYLRSILDWLPEQEAQRIPLARTCWRLLCDFHLSPVVLRHPPQHLALAVIQLALNIYVVTVPYSNSATYSWQEVPLTSIVTTHMFGDKLLSSTLPPTPGRRYLSLLLSLPTCLVISFCSLLCHLLLAGGTSHFYCHYPHVW
ncbi:FAM58A [Cordylochernes scorpioides]|uniref:FAM58A n=1 Tax=Cordylochernes scorpioides TaxID=51811 RepID=A0ABY6KD21_9ARAC|nr:FAM58A [Cordylochernes scorpioides]